MPRSFVSGHVVRGEKSGPIVWDRSPKSIGHTGTRQVGIKSSDQI